MDGDLITALSGKAPLSVLLITVALPDYTIRWTDGGWVPWGAETYREVDPTFGVVSELEDIEDGVGDQATSWAMTIMPPPEALSDLADPAVQRSLITVHFGAVNPATGVLIGEPDLVTRVEYDVPRLGVGQSVAVDLECITEEARMLEPNEERIQSNAFHQSIWAGEKHYEFQSSARIKIWWRDDGPSV